MRDKTDEELYCLLYRDAQNSLDAIVAAREEFTRRQLDEPTMSRIVAAAEKALEETKVMSDPEETGAGWGWSDYGSGLKQTATGWGCLILLCFVGYGIYGGYEWLDGDGWIPHDHDTPVWIHGNWMVGEYRDCVMHTAGFVGLKPEVRAELPRLLCGDRGTAGSEPEFLDEFHYDDPHTLAAMDAVLYGGDWREFDNMFHVLPVLYHGRIDRQAVPTIEWRCQRLSASLECKAVN
jgi:hypothetical protein